jgi:hypothetical protein
MTRWVILTATALALSACGDKAGTGGRPEPTPDAGTLHLVVDETYAVGDRARVRLANDTGTTYVFNDTGYEACNMTYTDETGHEFIIPPGTHCDLVTMADLPPGATAFLFFWSLDECTRDDWGCVKSRPLEPGTYTISGAFEAKDGGDRTPVRATFEIVAA